ncbi:peptidase A24 [Longispora fulva]|uniref:Leader peptidase (Prepilin peptidase)/N-methyltransferase n=1 Tax=Longispora fulva TaxID=619741 RepID=A0A8J7GEM1_9ACTN|nr:peptidase A24 [Longispora fulva]MBG6136301.1 leader peptidase (prepilin peptidase)/N-methyltransferase [Longispora fulva]
MSNTEDAVAGAVCAAVGCGLLAWRLPTNRPSEMCVLAAWLVLAGVGLILAQIDLAVYRLPTPILAATAFVTTGLIGVTSFLTPDGRRLVTASVFGSLLYGGLYLAASWVSRAQVGLGDVRLAAILGVGLGALGPVPLTIGILAPYVLATPLAVALMLRGGTVVTSIPFGPFMVTAAVLAALQ